MCIQLTTIIWKIECNKKRKPKNKKYIECEKVAPQKAKKAEPMAQAHVASKNNSKKYIKKAELLG